MLANVNIVIKYFLVIVTYVYIWECTQERNHISALIVKTSDIADTLDLYIAHIVYPLLYSSESAP